MSDYVSIPNIKPSEIFKLNSDSKYIVFNILKIEGTLLVPSDVSATIFIINGVINTGLPNNRAGIWVAPGGQIICNNNLKLQSVVPSNNSKYEYCPSYFADNLGLVISGGTKNFTCKDEQYIFAKSEDVESSYRASVVSGNIEMINLGSLVLNYNIMTFVGVVSKEVSNLSVKASGYKTDDSLQFFGTDCSIENVFIDCINSENILDLDENSTININKSLLLINRNTNLINQKNVIQCTNNSSLNIIPNAQISINSKFLSTINDPLEVSGPDTIYYLPKINEPIYQRGQIQTNGVTFSSETT